MYMADHMGLTDKSRFWKMAAWPISGLLILGLLVWQSYRKPDIQSHHHFIYILRALKDHIVFFLRKEKLGMDENYVIVNEEEFVSALKETLYKTNHNGKNLREFFDTGAFKILIQDNVCYIHANLDKTSQYISRSPLALRADITYFAVSWSNKMFKAGESFDITQVQGGSRPGYYHFLGKPDVKSFVVFSEEMNDLYLWAFIFKNIPPLSLGEIL
jgi:hypothetical protein